MKRLTLCSPSQANLDKIGKYFPLSNFHNRATLNANTFPSPTVSRSESDVLRLLYVGRLDCTKGVDFLLSVCEKIIKDHSFLLTIVGGGPDEEKLKTRFGTHPWVTFTGWLPQKEVSNYMVNADLLCFPSLWAEILGGVAVHALTLGVPVIGSNRGGIPELVEHDKNGLLVPAGDEAKWEKAIRRALEKPADLARWRSYAIENANRFSQDNLAKAIYAIATETMERPIDG